MTSKSIYGCVPARGTDGRYHYIYRITNLVENKHYYGSRTSKIDPYLDLGKKYFSSAKSNKWIIADQKTNPQNYKYKIVASFMSRKDATAREVSLHRKFDVKTHDKFYNTANQSSSRFDCTGTISVKDAEGNFFQVSLTDERYLSGVLVPTRKGLKTSEETKRKMSISMTGKLRSKETRETMSKQRKGTVIVVDKEGKKFRTSVNDPRYVSGELVSHNKGYFLGIDSEGNLFYITRQDPRFISGELRGIQAGKKQSEEVIAKKRESRKGYRHSEETKQKMREAKRKK